MHQQGSAVALAAFLGAWRCAGHVALDLAVVDHHHPDEHARRHLPPMAPKAAVSGADARTMVMSW
jgi:hypothetical protein